MGGKRLNMFCDFETTGKWADSDYVIAIACIVDEKVFYEKCKPLKFKDNMASNIHGISYFEMQRSKDAIEMFVELIKWFKSINNSDYAFNFIAHQPNGFDWNMICATIFQLDDDTLTYKWRRLFHGNIYSTFDMSRSMGYKKNSLKHWQARLNFELDHHDALSDARACKIIWENLNEYRNFEGAQQTLI